LSMYILMCVGTTRETLDVLTNSLMDLDYKLLLVLNKVDKFNLVHDFARAYGYVLNDF